MGNLDKDFFAASKSLAELGRQLAPSFAALDSSIANIAKAQVSIAPAMDALATSGLAETIAGIPQRNAAMLQNSGIGVMARIIEQHNQEWSVMAERLSTAIQLALPPADALADVAKKLEFASRPILPERTDYSRTSWDYSAIMQLPPSPTRYLERANERLEEKLEASQEVIAELDSQLNAQQKENKHLSDELTKALKELHSLRLRGDLGDYPDVDPGDLSKN